MEETADPAPRTAVPPTRSVPCCRRRCPAPTRSTSTTLRSAVRAFVTAGHQPGDVVADTNRLLLDGLGPALLASCCYARFHPRSGVVRIVRAGHCPPLLRLPDGRAQILDVPGGPLLGVVDTAEYPESELRLAPGSVLALYTDGLVERRGSDIGSGIERLRVSLAHMGAGRLKDLADGLLRDASQSADRADDIALLLTEYAPSPLPQTFVEPPSAAPIRARRLRTSE